MPSHSLWSSLGTEHHLVYIPVNGGVEPLRTELQSVHFYIPVFGIYEVLNKRT